MNLMSLRACLQGVSAFRDLMQQPIFLHTIDLLDALNVRQGERAMDAYCALFHALRKEGFQGMGLWLWDQLRYMESPYAKLAEMGGTDPALENAALVIPRDRELFQNRALLRRELLRLLPEDALEKKMDRWVYLTELAERIEAEKNK